MNVVPPSTTRAALASLIALGASGVVLLAVVGQAQTVPAANTQAALSRPLPAEPAAAIPSLPGYGFSGKPAATGWNPIHIARAWIVLMKRLGYTRFVAQGGDWGNSVTELMALQGAPELIGIHTNMPATVPADVARALQFGQAPPPGLSAEGKGAWAWEQPELFSEEIRAAFRSLR